MGSRVVTTELKTKYFPINNNLWKVVEKIEDTIGGAEALAGASFMCSARDVYDEKETEAIHRHKKRPVASEAAAAHRRHCVSPSDVM